ncbi:hypothetical protein HK101_008360 [Irineochytrium annulatum]|nr:hypothetical protein HK101_008360 [Irineochytrium annulatum]
MKTVALYFRCLGAVLARACRITAIVGAFTVGVWALVIFATRNVTTASVFGSSLPFFEDSQVYGQCGSMMWAKNKILIGPVVDSTTLSVVTYAIVLLIWHSVKALTFVMWFFAVLIPGAVLFEIPMSFMFEQFPRTWGNTWANMLTYAKLSTMIHLLGALALIFMSFAFNVGNYGNYIAITSNSPSIQGLELALSIGMALAFYAMKHSWAKLYSMMPHWKKVTPASRKDEVLGNILQVIFFALHYFIELKHQPWRK